MEKEVTGLHDLRGKCRTSIKLRDRSMQLRDVSQSEQEQAAIADRTASLAAEVQRLLAVNQEAGMQIAGLHAGKTALEAQITQLQGWSQELQEAVQYHEGQAAAARQQLASIENSITWRLAQRAFRWVRPVRGAVCGVGIVMSPRGIGQRWYNLVCWLRAYA